MRQIIFMTLSAHDIAHIARLARLDLTKQELTQYRRELSGIVRYVDQLQKVKLKKVSRKTKVGESNLRLDEIKPWTLAEREAALAEAPHKQGRQIKTQRILG